MNGVSSVLFGKDVWMGAMAPKRGQKSCGYQHHQQIYSVSWVFEQLAVAARGEG
jgi:hypothetical protein